MNQPIRNLTTQVTKIPALQSTQQTNQNNHSNKLLSPFTWSNLQIKLPKLHKPSPHYATIEQKPSKQKRKVKGRSQQKGKEKVKLDLINRTINLDYIGKKEAKSQLAGDNRQRYRKESIQSVNQSINLDLPEGMGLTNPEKLRDFKRDLITRHLQKSIQRNQSPKGSVMNRTSLDFSRLRSPLSYTSKTSSATPLTFSYNKMETYIYKALIKCNWCEIPKESTLTPQLIWSDHYLQHTKLGKDQLHNHIKNAHTLTTKSSLHELQSIHGSEHYPQSFIMPFQYQNFCEEYEQNVVKICLKDIVKNGYSRINVMITRAQKSLGLVLRELQNKNTPNQDTMMAIRLCLYLEQYRKCKNYRFFEHSEQYVPIETKLQASMLSTLLKACHEYWQSLNKPQPSASLYFKTSHIDLDILQVLYSYHCMFLKLQPSYQSISPRNSWIIKPIASSRGAGISLLKNSSQFLTINHSRFQMANKSKFLNKIIQKYVEEPLLLGEGFAGFQGRKFDIRQWVLLACDKQTGEPLIYVFEDGYCRFSDMKFTYNHYRSDQPKIHLTNYSISDKSNPQSSLLLLSQLFTGPQTPLHKTYLTQLSKIVVQTTMNAKQLQFEAGKFELLGYDVIMDRNEKLWLLEVNFNPACQASRAQKLERIVDKMVGDMMGIVRAASQRGFLGESEREGNGWKLVYGKENFKEINLSEGGVQTNIKPFYSLSLGNDSLVQEVRRRNFMMNTITKTVTRSNLREIWQTLTQFQPAPKTSLEQPKQEPLEVQAEAQAQAQQ